MRNRLATLACHAADAAFPVIVGLVIGAALACIMGCGYAFEGMQKSRTRAILKAGSLTGEQVILPEAQWADSVIVAAPPRAR